MVPCLLAALALAGPSVMERSANHPLTLGDEGHIGSSVADLDGDGLWDLVYPHDADDIGVWLSTLGAGAVLPDGSDEDVVAALPYDVDADGIVDVVVVHRDRVVWHINDGSGGVRDDGEVLATTLGLGSSDLRGAAAIDLDHNGHIDLLLSHTTGFQGLSYDHPTAAFQSLTVPGLPTSGLNNVDSLLVSDLDHDGEVDIAARHDTSSTGPVWLWRSTSYANETTPDLTTGADHGSLMACAWSQPWGQLFYSKPHNGGGDEANTWWSYSGTDFVLDEEMDFENGIRGLACGDFDHDGDLDLFVADDGTDRLCLAPWVGPSNPGCDGVGDGQARSIAPTTVDFDDDGDLDVLVPGDDEPLQVFVTTAPTDRYLQVRVLTPVGSCEQPAWRDDIGAQVSIAGASPPWREVSGGEQRGQLPWPVLHFGGVDGGTAVTLRIHPAHKYADFEMAVVPDSLTPLKRIEVRLDDPDGDGLVDEPRTVDSDGDGVLDFLDDDLDGDGVLDIDEFADPCSLPDSDGDGIADPYDPVDDTPLPTALTGDTGDTDTGGSVQATAGDTATTAGDTAGPTDPFDTGPSDPTLTNGTASGKAAAGCGCVHGGASSAWLVFLGALLARRRRSVA